MKTLFKVILPTTILIFLGVTSWRSFAKDAESARLAADTETLRRTAVTAHLEAPLEPGKNVLWCGTFQLAWNEICALVGEDLHFAGGDPAVVGRLNQKRFTRSDVDEACCVAIADFVMNNVHDKIRSALKAKFNFDVTRRFHELQGELLVVKNPQIAKDLRILSAAQNIRFELNEKGVKLRSESHIALGCSAAPRPKNPRRMIFDKPFLVLLQRAGAKAPYFAMWVDNPEILAH